ncbi:terminase TerL endonuclease subunit [Aromatoleum aromaticum]
MCHQGFNGVNPGICNLEAELLNKRLRHGMHPVLTMAAAGAVTEINSEGQRRFSKRKATARIDGIVSLAMCFSAAFKVEEEEREPEYQMIFL